LLRFSLFGVFLVFSHVLLPESRAVARLARKIPTISESGGAAALPANRVMTLDNENITCAMPSP